MQTINKYCCLTTYELINARMILKSIINDVNRFDNCNIVYKLKRVEIFI